MKNQYHEYTIRLTEILRNHCWDDVQNLAHGIYEAWRNQRQFFICGNGGSAANAVHLANDFLYGVGSEHNTGIKVESLSANPAVLTCLANDIGYDEIYAHQLNVKADADDVLVILSGSGNSANVVRALEVGNEIKMRTFAIVGYSGGRCKELAEIPIYFPINDMQIAEDLQLIVGHMCMQSVKRLIDDSSPK
jgi:D-sedoheptulose 7-phosphate isomerase